jgi:hypothetical protein
MHSIGFACLAYIIGVTYFRKNILTLIFLYKKVEIFVAIDSKRVHLLITPQPLRLGEGDKKLFCKQSLLT